jgi:hypothetical protein
MNLLGSYGLLGPNHITTMANIKNRKLDIEAILLIVFLFIIAALTHLNQRKTGGPKKNKIIKAKTK